MRRVESSAGEIGAHGRPDGHLVHVRMRRLLDTLKECPASGCEFCHLRGGHGEFRREAEDVSVKLLRKRYRQWIGRDRFQLQWIEPRAVIGDAIIEMRSGRQTGRADV